MPRNGWSVRPVRLDAQLSKFEIRDFAIKNDPLIQQFRSPRIYRGNETVNPMSSKDFSVV